MDDSFTVLSGFKDGLDPRTGHGKFQPLTLSPKWGPKGVQKLELHLADDNGFYGLFLMSVFGDLEGKELIWTTVSRF